VSSAQNDGGRSAMNVIMKKLIDEEWFVKTIEEKLRHFCKYHGPMMEQAYPLGKRSIGGCGVQSHLRSSGSIDSSGLLTGVVVPSKVASVTHTPEEAKVIRSKQSEIEEKARLEAERLRIESLKKLRSKFERGMKAFDIDDKKD
jgi:hypothetical protein